MGQKSYDFSPLLFTVTSASRFRFRFLPFYKMLFMNLSFLRYKLNKTSKIFLLMLLLNPEWFIEMLPSLLQVNHLWYRKNTIKAFSGIISVHFCFYIHRYKCSGRQKQCTLVTVNLLYGYTIVKFFVSFERMV